MQLIAKKGVKIYRDFYIDMEIKPPFAPKVAKIPVAKIGDAVVWKKTIGDRVERFEVLAVLSNETPIYSPFSGYFSEIIIGTEFGRNPAYQYAVLEDISTGTPAFPLWDINIYQASHTVLEIIKKAAIINECTGNYLINSLLQNNYNEVYIDAVDEQPYDLSKTATLLSYKNEVILGAKMLLKAINAKSFKLLLMKNFRTEKLIKELKGDAEVICVKGRYPFSPTINDFVNKNNGIRVGANCCRAVYRAVFFGEPQLTSIVTVWGDGVKEPSNVEVYNGTPINEILESCGVFGILERAVAGGVMRGYTSSISFPLFRWDTSLTALPLKKHHKTVECINCGRCAMVCPMGLAPYYILRNSKRIGESKAKELCGSLCEFCGACSYICPSRISLNDRISDYIKQGRGK